MDLSFWMTPPARFRPSAVLRLGPTLPSKDQIARSINALARAGFGGVLLDLDPDVPRETRRSLPKALAVALKRLEQVSSESPEGPHKEEIRVWLGEGIWRIGARALLEEKPQTAGLRLGIERCLGLEDARRQAAREEALGVYILSLRQGLVLNGLELLDGDTRPAEDGSEMLVAVSECSPQAPDALGRLDLLNPKVANQLVRSTVRHCLARAGSGKADLAAIAGVCLPRPATGCVNQGTALWTKRMPRLYEERWGEEVLPLLPLLWFDAPGAERFRWRYRTLVAELLESYFLRPLAEWCRESGAQAIGPVGRSDSPSADWLESGAPPLFSAGLLDASGACGAAVASRSLFALKTAFSTVRKIPSHPANGVTDSAGEAKADVLCEIGAGAGRSPAALLHLSADAGRCLAMGPGALLAATSPASLAGDGKRSSGAMPLIESQPWWPHLEACNRAFARWRAVLDQGRRRTGLLVIVPSDSIAALARTPLPENMAGIEGAPERGQGGNAREIEEPFLQMLRILSGRHLDFDLADEETIARHGKAQANAFLVGAREYTTVALPPALSWRENTIKELRRFVRKGGSVVAARPIAPEVDFQPSSDIERLAQEFPNLYIVERPGREVAFQVNRVDPKMCLIRPRGECRVESLLVQRRRTESRDLFFVTNASCANASCASASREDAVEALLSLQANGAVRLLDPWNGTVFAIETREEKGALTFPFTFHPGQSALFAVGGERDPNDPPYEAPPRATSELPLDDTWECERLDPNLMPLRTCRTVLDGGALSPPQSVELARVEVAGGSYPRETRIPDQKETEGLQDSPETAPRDNGVTLTFPFDSRIDGEGRRVELLVERCAGQTVRFNGEPLQLAVTDPLIDPAFGRANVSALLRPGPNEVVIRFGGDAPPVVEAPILAGDFAVELAPGGEPTPIAEPDVLTNGSWTDQGYPYYAGRMRYRQKVAWPPERASTGESGEQRFFIALRDPAGAAFSVRVAGHDPVSLFFPPWRVEITRLVQPENEDLEIEVAGTLQNLFGVENATRPLANAGESAPGVALEAPPNDWRISRRKPSIIPFGLVGGAVIEVFDPAAAPALSATPAREETQETDSEEDERDDAGEDPAQMPDRGEDNA
ncbi:MAG TPA: hypothetical protein VM492_13785 [Sumerlaeia bacterium]|nr:hypothetical protein [Sumerlaeia bacterium]